jgi:hypothetical protein
MADGIYRIAFTGAHGSGFGVLALVGGVVAGADVGGVLYDGTYQKEESGDQITLLITMRVPAGSTPVQTGIAFSSPADIPMTVSLPTDLAGGAPILIDTPLGKVNVIVTKIRGITVQVQGGARSGALE